MIPAIVILAYLLVVAYIGSVAYRRGKENTEDFFLASRTIGSAVFFLSLFATNMTAFAILGSSGVAYRRGIGIYGLMASSSGLVIPLSIFLIGTRLWVLGKRFGHQTQVQYFRDRWECSGIGTVMFALSASMLIPYMIISIIGGGTVLADISREGAAGDPLIPYALGCFIVTLVVTLNVFFGGMRGIVWVNVFQTILFLVFGAVALLVINHNLPGGIAQHMQQMKEGPLAPLLTRERIPQEEFWSYTFIPLSSIMFPHMAIMCFSARKMSAFKRTVVLYPLAIMAIWLPCVFLGTLGAQLVPGVERPDGVLLRLLGLYSPVWLAGLLGAGIISAVMGSDCHQVLALSTMFTKDVFEHYGGKQRYGERGSVLFARAFILLVTILAYVVALLATENIFEIAIRFAFSGFAAMAPIMVAALFWKRSTKWGALAATLWVAFTLAGSAVLANRNPPGTVFWQVGDQKVLYLTAPPPRPARAGGPVAPAPGGGPGMRPGGPVAPAPGGAGAAGGMARPGGPRPAGPGAAGGAPARTPPFNPDVRVLGFMTVVPMVLGSALLMILVSLLTRPPSQATIERYFSAAKAAPVETDGETTAVP
jgi:SSS family solute:Na+ symporter